MTRIVVKPMTTYRFRIISESAFTAYNFSIDGHKMTIIETDGVDTVPYTVDRITVNNGQRYSLLVRANEGGPWGDAFFIRVIALLDWPWSAPPPGEGYMFNGAAILQCELRINFPPIKKLPVTYCQSDRCRPLVPKDLQNPNARKIHRLSTNAIQSVTRHSRPQEGRRQYTSLFCIQGCTSRYCAESLHQF